MLTTTQKTSAPIGRMIGAEIEKNRVKVNSDTAQVFLKPRS